MFRDSAQNELVVFVRKGAETTLDDVRAVNVLDERNDVGRHGIDDGANLIITKGNDRL